MGQREEARGLHIIRRNYIYWWNRPNKLLTEMRAVDVAHEP